MRATVIPEQPTTLDLVDGFEDLLAELHEIRANVEGVMEVSGGAEACREFEANATKEGDVHYNLLGAWGYADEALGQLDHVIETVNRTVSRLRLERNRSD